jgi:hypothetical protein
MRRRPKKLKRVKRAKPNTGSSRPGTDQTAAGEQHFILRAERTPSAEFARRRAAEPLKQKVKQNPADRAVFSEESKQIDFIDQLADRPQVESTIASVSFMITQQQKEMLRGLGYTDEQICEMKPENAHAVLKEGIKVSYLVG